MVALGEWEGFLVVFILVDYQTIWNSSFFSVFVESARRANVVVCMCIAIFEPSLECGMCFCIVMFH